MVVGGGIAGLVWAVEAATRGMDVTVLEAGDRAGGAVRREQIGDVATEVGAEAFAIARPEVLTLVEELGLSERVVRPATYQAHLLTARGLLPLPPGFLGIPVDLDDIARLVGSRAAAEAARLDAIPLAGDAPLPPTVGALVRERLGAAVAAQLVDPVIAGVHATPADEAELMSVAPQLAAAVRRHGGLLPAARALRGPLGPAGAPVATLTGGLSLLVDALVARVEYLGGTVRTGSPATGLHRRPAGWRVTLDDGHLDAEVVGVALPPTPATQVLGTVLTTASDEVRRRERAVGSAADPATQEAIGAVRGALRELRATEVTLVTLLLADATLAAAGAPVGSGVLVAPEVTDVHAKAMTHASAKWSHVAAALTPGHHLVRLSYGGRPCQCVPAAAAGPGAVTGHEVPHPGPEAPEHRPSMVEVAFADTARVLGDALGDATVRASRVTRWRHGLVRPLVGRQAAVTAVDDALVDVPDLALLGGSLAGNGLAGVVARSRAEAARTLS